MSQCNPVEVRFASFTASYVQRFIAYLKNKGNTPNSVLTKLSVLRAVYNKAVEEAKKTLNEEASDKDALEKAAKDLSDRIMPIGAKMYQEASKDESKSDDDKKSDDKDEPVEGEVVDK